MINQFAANNIFKSYKTCKLHDNKPISLHKSSLKTKHFQKD